MLLGPMGAGLTVYCEILSIPFLKCFIVKTTMMYKSLRWGIVAVCSEEIIKSYWALHNRVG